MCMHVDGNECAGPIMAKVGLPTLCAPRDSIAPLSMGEHGVGALSAGFVAKLLAS
jgi:hypothetical protein